MAKTKQDDTTQEELNGTHWKCVVCRELKNWNEEDPSFDCEWYGFHKRETICEECIKNEEIKRNTNVLDYKNGLTEKDKIDYTDMVDSLSAFNKLLKKKKHTYDETVVLTLLADEVDDIRFKIQEQLYPALEKGMFCFRKGEEYWPDYDDWQKRKQKRNAEKTKKRKIVRVKKAEKIPKFAS